MNKIILKGRLTANPELKQTPNGIAVAKFSVAVNRRFDREKVDFINCEAWRNTAEFISKYFSKGKEIAIAGELHIDKNNDKYYTTVVVDEAEFCGSKGDSDVKVEFETDTPNMTELGQEEELPF